MSKLEVMSLQDEGRSVVEPSAATASCDGGLKGHLAARCLGAALLLGLAVGCATKQVVPLDVGPAPVVLYLDGEEQKELPQSLELESNRDHTLFFRKEGYRPEMVVLRTMQVEGEPVLVPERVEIEMERLKAASRPGLTLTVEDDE